MYIEEEKRLNVLVAEIPVAGVFKPSSGKIFMKIHPMTGHEIQAVCLTSGTVCTFPVTAKAEYFKNASVLLKH